MLLKERIVLSMEMSELIKSIACAVLSVKRECEMDNPG